MDSLLLVVILSISSINTVYSEAEVKCISKLHLYAGTGDTVQDQSNGAFSLKFIYLPANQTLSTGSTQRYDVELYDRPGTDRDRSKGDVWTFERPHDCSTVEGIQDVETFMIDFTDCNRDNDWHIVDAMVYAELGNTSDLVMLAISYGIDDPITNRNAVFLKLSTVEHDNCKSKDQCITEMYVMAETSGASDKAGSDDGHLIQINDETPVRLYDRSGNDYRRNKADLWIYTASDIGVIEGECLKFGNVTFVGFRSGGTDGWLVKTAIVTVKLESGKYALLAGDTDFNEWVEKNSAHPSRAKVPLALKNGVTENCD